MCKFFLWKKSLNDKAWFTITGKPWNLLKLLFRARLHKTSKIRSFIDISSKWHAWPRKIRWIIYVAMCKWALCLAKPRSLFKTTWWHRDIMFLLHFHFTKVLLFKEVRFVFFWENSFYWKIKNIFKVSLYTCKEFYEKMWKKCSNDICAARFDLRSRKWDLLLLPCWRPKNAKNKHYFPRRGSEINKFRHVSLQKYTCNKSGLDRPWPKNMTSFMEKGNLFFCSDFLLFAPPKSHKFNRSHSRF